LSILHSFAIFDYTLNIYFKQEKYRKFELIYLIFLFFATIS